MAHPHSFSFCKKCSSDTYQINCASSGTVLQSLQTSHQFMKLVNNRTFVIERQQSATDGVISDKFPCHLLREGELLKIHTFVKDAQEKDERSQDAEDVKKTKGARGELVIFTVASKGGKNTKTKQIVRNKKLNKFETLVVYAYSDETIATALKRDGRFTDIVFQDGCELQDLNEKTKLEINQNARALHGQSYEICLPRGKNSKLPENPDPKKGEICKPQEKQKLDRKRKVPEEAESFRVNEPESKIGKKIRIKKSEKQDKHEIKIHKTSINITDFGEIYKILRSQFPLLLNQLEERSASKRKQYQQRRKEDFMKSTQPFSTMHRLEKIERLGTSVCRVRVGNEEGTGFLLFDNFILTNAHVIERSYNSRSKELTSPAAANFTLGSERLLDRGFPLSSDVFAFLKGRDSAGRYLDFALLKLQEHHEEISKLPRLLHHYSSNQHAQGIGIIGHPGADKKRVTVFCTVPQPETGSSAGGSSIQVSFNCFPNFLHSACKVQGSFIARYSAYFLKGSSGSPVFDEDCNLIAMHTGGFFMDDMQEHAIGLQIPLHSIIWNVMEQLASRDSLDEMFKFIETATQNPHLEEYLKECARVLMGNPSEKNATLLARIYIDTRRNGMQNLSQKIHKALNENRERVYVQRILQEIIHAETPPSSNEVTEMDWSPTEMDQ